MSYRLSKEILETFLGAGMDVDEICRQIGCVRSTVYNNLRKFGLDFPSRDLLPNTHFGALQIIGKSHTDGWDAFYECSCECGNIVVVKRCNLTSGVTKSCGCSRRGKLSKNYTGYEDISGKYWASIKHAARSRNLPIDITIQEAWQLFVGQGGRCALTGLPLTFGKEQTASLDRVDSSLGYISGNVQWVHKDVNFMKQDFPQDYFIEVCKLVSRGGRT